MELQTLREGVTSFGNTLVEGAQTGASKCGEFGGRVITAIQDNPKAAAATLVAGLALGAGYAYQEAIGGLFASSVNGTGLNGTSLNGTASV